MALGFTSKVVSSDNVDRSSYTTGTYTPSTSGVMVVIGLSHSVASGTIGDATAVTGASITGMQKIKTQPFNTSTVPIKKAEMWVGTSTGSAGTVTIALPNTPTSCGWSIVEVTGADMAQGTGGIIQSLGIFTDSGVNGAFTGTLSAFADPNNGGIAFASEGQNTTLSGNGWTGLNTTGWNSPTITLGTLYTLTENVTCSGTFTANGMWAGVAAEIAVPSSVTQRPWPQTIMVVKQ